MSLPRAIVHRLGDRVRSAITAALKGAAEALEGAARAQLERAGQPTPPPSLHVSQDMVAAAAARLARWPPSLHVSQDMVAAAAARLARWYGYELVYVERHPMRAELEVSARHVCGQRRVIAITDAVAESISGSGSLVLDALEAAFRKPCLCGLEPN